MSFDSGASLRPDSARGEHLLQEARAALQAQDVPRAEAMAREALALGFIHPLLLHLRSFWFARLGRDDEALADLHRAVTMAPDDVLVRNAYGVLLSKFERWPQALEQLKVAVKLKPDFAKAHLGLGWAYEGNGDLVGARDHFMQAVALDPHLVEALVRLASLGYRLAEWELAREMSIRALALDPQQYAALSIQAALAVIDKDLERAEALLRPLLARTPGSVMNSVMVRRVLGDLRHAQGRYVQAFAAYTAGNRTQYSKYAPKFEGPGNAFEYCSWLVTYFSAADRQIWSAKQSSAPDDPRGGAKGHGFIVGFPRSGTTLLENVLASHPEVSALSERDAFGDLTNKFLMSDEGASRLAALSNAEIADCRASYWERVKGFEQIEGKVLVDKMPLTLTRMPLVAKLFPKAKIVFAVRDPRDVVLSGFRRSFMMNTYMFELLSIERAAGLYDVVMRLAMTYRDKLDLDWHELRNESLIDDFEGETRKLFSFLGTEWHDEVNDFARKATGRNIRTPSAHQVVRGINSDSVGTWRKYRAQLGPILPVLRPWIEHFGYPAD